MEAPPEPARVVKYASPRARASWAIVAVAVATAITIVAGAITIVAGGLVTQALVGPFMPVAAATAPVAVLIVVSLVVEAILVPAALASWTLRCRRNLGVLPGPRPRWSPAWAACGWFIPIANLFVPLLCLRETWSASAGRRAPILLLPWWALWLTRVIPVVWLTIGLAGRLPASVGVTATALYVAAVFLSGAGAIVVVLRLTLLQERRLRPLQEGSDAAPTWNRAPRPARAIAIVAIVAIALATAGGALMLAANTISLALGSFSLAFGIPQLLLAWAAGLATFVLFGPLIGTIATALWARVTYRNLASLGAPRLSWSPGWAAAVWFVPTANLAVPYLVLRDAWPNRERALLRCWWVTWLTSLALGLVSNVLHVIDVDVPQVAGDAVGLVGDLALLPAGVLAVIVILTITRHQTQIIRSRELS
jgi:Domain of unknown function (DUF4328)